MPGQPSETYSYDAADRLTSTTGPAGTTAFGYDAVGNTTTTGADSYTWNAAGMMTSATVDGTSTDYTYDGDNRRLSALVTHPDATVTGTRFAWDPLSYDLAAEHDPSGSPVRAYLPGGLGVIDPATGTTTFQHPDALGSVQAATGTAGTTAATADYEPYGNLKNATGTAASPAGFTGAYTDPTGLIHLRARQYDPEIGRFLSPDPLGGGYTYAASNPARFVDPYGLWPSLRGTLNIVKQVSGYVAVGAAFALAVTPVGAAALGATLLWATAIGTASSAALAYQDCTNHKGTCAGAILETALWAAGGKVTGGHVSGTALNTLDNAATTATRTRSHLPSPAAPEALTATQRGRYLFDNWHSATFPNRTQSVNYHLARHGNGRTAFEYTRDAQNFFSQNRGLATQVTLRDGTAGLRIQTKVPVPGGGTRNVGEYWTTDGRLVTFWD